MFVTNPKYLTPSFSYDACSLIYEGTKKGFEPIN